MSIKDEIQQINRQTEQLADVRRELEKPWPVDCEEGQAVVQLRAAYEQVAKILPPGTAIHIEFEASYGRINSTHALKIKTDVTLGAVVDGESFFEFGCSLEDIEDDAHRLLREITRKRRIVGRGRKAIDQVA